VSATADPGADLDGSARRLPAGRKADLAAYVVQLGQVTVAQLAERFSVSVDTIRRDLDQLDADGVLIRTHGGAVSLSASPRPDSGVDVRARMQTSAKDTIGALAASLIPDGSSLVINAGTTTLALTRHLHDRRDLTIATNSLTIPTEIDPRTFRDLYVFGGTVRLSAQATVGPVVFPLMTTGQIDIRCDLALIAVGGVSHDRGYMTSSPGEATMMREMMARAEEVIVLADSTKFGRRLFAQIAELGRADRLVTDLAPPEKLGAALRSAGVEVLTPPDAAPED
jgi:DeoR family fructose operon transcriptional repressor